MLIGRQPLVRQVPYGEVLCHTLQAVRQLILALKRVSILLNISFVGSGAPRVN